MNYLRIDKEDICNGEGLRVVLWLSGCYHKCKGCQNPQTWDANSGIPFDESAKDELFRELDNDYISSLTLTGGDSLFERNLDSVLDLVIEVNKRYNTLPDIDVDNINNHNILRRDANETRLSSPKKSICLYTGYDFVEMLKDAAKAKDKKSLKRFMILKNVDVLVDGRYVDSERDITLPYRGSKNQRLIDIQQSLQKGKIVLWQT